ncbi:hypothetical protein C1H46_005942 [Malus baccata]|uniref:Uncharacterized protein n=1 Tax=Malus baccata TaxID=106549 RepID=A0A540NBP9_MALBA|nr:hypothetical protein C1H46_005942 [Malus baccata]
MVYASPIQSYSTTLAIISATKDPPKPRRESNGLGDQKVIKNVDSIQVSHHVYAMLLGNQILASNPDLAMQASVVFPLLLASKQSAPLLHQSVVFKKTIPSSFILTLFIQASGYPSHTIMKLQRCCFLRPIRVWQLFGGIRPIIVSVFNKTMSTALGTTHPDGKIYLVRMEHGVTVPLTPAAARKCVIFDGSLTYPFKIFNHPTARPVVIT